MPRILSRRGRPPHPDILTPAEWQVLEGVRSGGTNQQIADQLGITYHTVKYHISNMLGKLQLEDRHQLANWRPAATITRPRWPQFGLAHLGTAKVAGGALAGATVIGLGVAALIIVSAMRSDERDLGLLTDVAPVSPPSSSTVTARVQTIPEGMVSGNHTSRREVDFRGRTFTFFWLEAGVARAFPDSLEIDKVNVSLVARTPQTTETVSVGHHDHFVPAAGTGEHKWAISIHAGPLPVNTIAVEIRVEEFAATVPGEPRMVLGPWVAIAEVTGPPPPSVDLTEFAPPRIDTGFGWAWVVDGVERFAETLYVRYHAEGVDTDLLRWAPPTRSQDDPEGLPLGFTGREPFIAQVRIPAGAQEMRISFGPVRRLADQDASVDDAPIESGEWSFTIPLE